LAILKYVDFKIYFAPDDVRKQDIAPVMSTKTTFEVKPLQRNCFSYCCVLLNWCVTVLSGSLCT